MAFVFRRKSSKYWIMVFTDHVGRKRQKSSKSVDRNEALRMAQAVERMHRSQRGPEYLKILLAEAYEEVSGESVLTFRSFSKMWLDRKQGEISSNTFSRYQSAIDRFIKFLGKDSDQPLPRLQKRHVQSFRDSLAKELSPSSTNLHLKILRAMLEDARKDSLISSNVASLVPNLRVDKSSNKRRAFTLPEIRLLLDHAEGEWRGMILVGVYTGQRLVDVATLTWSNIDFENQEIHFQTRKTSRVVILPMAERLKNYLQDLLPFRSKSDPVFPKSFHVVESQGRTGNLSNGFRKILESAGLAEKRGHQATKSGRGGKREPSELSFHCLRYTATSFLKNAGISESVVMDIIGHDSAAISRSYTKISSEAKRAAIESMPDFDV